MSTELNSGTVGGFGHMGPNDPYNDGHSGSGSSGGSFNGGGNGGHDNSSGSSYTASFGLITGRHPITVPGTKNINSVDLSAVINNIIHHEGARNNMYLDTANNVTVGIGRMLPNSQAGYNLGFTKTHHIPRGHGDSEDVEISASHGDIDSAFNATKEKRASNVHLSDQSMVADCVNQLDKDRTTLRNMYTDFDHFPQPAKTALHDMLYNLGEGKLHSEFPNFNAAVNRKDWTRAATESHRTGIGDSRNKDTHDQFIAAGNK
ncbi:hypothetical protein LH668_23035 [Enterobacter kobei]|nr:MULTISPECIES: hypothetical protein [Enterobacteriaceae]MCF1289680.1 hypothetical protein [Enterobacter kobei]MCF1343503.1 hypothetical protein [Enterobacter asburiae]MCH6342904.1 hypothetical protein [Escherichia coli]MCK6803468.1 hypothetical protein [Enterobacter cloacae]MCK6921205.1 hypothetical protein [Enterobacter kobei]